MKKQLLILAAVIMAASIGLAQTLVVSPAKLAVTGTQLQGATAATLDVYNGARSGTSYYTVTVPATTTWLSVSPASGSSTGEFDTVTVTFVTTGCVAGIYKEDITITQTNAPVTVKTIPVTITVNDDENLGVAVGPSSAATVASGIAIGSRSARAVAVGASTIQIGGGVGSSAGSTYVRGWQLLDASGNLPAARLPTAGLTGTKTNTVPNAAITNLSITTVAGQVTAISINGN